MKLLLISFIIVLSTYSVKTYDLLLIGFSNFNNPTDNKNEFSYDILFKKNNSVSEIDNYKFLYNNVSISNGTKTEQIELNCSKNEKDTNDDLSYNCKHEINSIIFGNITKLNASKIFLFSNDTKNFSDVKIVESSLIDETINNIQNQNNVLKFGTFYLKKVSNSTNRFTVDGDIKEQFNGTLNSSVLGKEVHALVINGSQISFYVNKYIDEHLNGKMAKIIEGDDSVDYDYILIYKNESNIKDLARYISPNSKLFVEVFRAGGFSKTTSKGNIYIRGSPELLKSLRKYIKFTARAIYNNKNLRNLEETSVNATGVKDDNESTENIVVYDVDYKGLPNSNSIDLKPNNDFIFSEDNVTYDERQLTVDVDQDINLNESNPEIPVVIDLKDPNEPVKYNPSSFEIEFNTSKLKFSSNESYFQYPTNIGNKTYEEINCNLFNKTNSNDYYKISCSTSKTIIALVKDLRITVPQISSKKRNLQATTNNKTFLFPQDNDKLMNYEYSAKTHDYFRRSKSTGLSAGAIVAIILSSIAALVAVGLVFFFLRKKQSPPVIKNQPDFNVINSTSNINN